MLLARPAAHCLVPGVTSSARSASFLLGLGLNVKQQDLCQGDFILESSRLQIVFLKFIIYFNMLGPQ